MPIHKALYLTNFYAQNSALFLNRMHSTGVSNFDFLNAEPYQQLVWPISQPGYWEGPRPCQSRRYNYGNVTSNHQVPQTYVELGIGNIEFTFHRPTITNVMDVPYMIRGFATALRDFYVKRNIKYVGSRFDMIYTGNPQVTAIGDFYCTKLYK
jgi:hypothetical protein